MKRFLVPGAIAIGVLLVIALGLNGGSSGGQASDIEVQNAALVTEGDVLYQASCAVCHGSDLRGTERGPSHLSTIYNPGHHGDGAFAIAAVNGVKAHHWNFGNMPRIPGLSDADLERIVAFVRENQRIEGYEPYPP
ncbi:MAG: cytochrome c [Actinomycetia bacterium]|nr:cytochrome c [Actinomycetes bacterium]